MSRKQNTFDGGTDGATIVAGTSGGASGDAFTGAPVGTGTTLTYSVTHPAHGTLGAHVTTSATAASAYVQFTLPTAVDVAWERGYFYLPALPATGTWPLLRWASAGGTTNCGSVEINASGQLVAKSSAGSTISTLTSMAVPTGKIVRIEGMLVGSTTVGQIEAKLFATDPEAWLPDATLTTASTVNTGAQPQLLRYGVGSSTASVDYYLDTVAGDDSNYPGPYAPSDLLVVGRRVQLG